MNHKDVLEERKWIIKRLIELDVCPHSPHDLKTDTLRGLLNGASERKT